jgi:hypothetical protein
MASASSQTSLQQQPMQSPPNSNHVPTLSRNRVDIIMTSTNTFTNARIGFGGHLSGADEKPHDLFKIERENGPVLNGALANPEAQQAIKDVGTGGEREVLICPFALPGEIK